MSTKYGKYYINLLRSYIGRFKVATFLYGFKIAWKYCGLAGILNISWRISACYIEMFQLISGIKNFIILFGQFSAEHRVSSCRRKFDIPFRRTMLREWQSVVILKVSRLTLESAVVADWKVLMEILCFALY